MLLINILYKTKDRSKVERSFEKLNSTDTTSDMNMIELSYFLTYQITHSNCQLSYRIVYEAA